MKPGIHPELVDTVVTCSCGYTFVTQSTEPAMHVDICSNCHPYFTGTQRLVDTAGQVERFNRRFEKRVEAPEVATKTPAKSARPAARPTRAPATNGASTDADESPKAGANGEAEAADGAAKSAARAAKSEETPEGGEGNKTAEAGSEDS